MINFFRKIRKQLADDNKPLKYARYAIGEILLVVIGILIALSVNNWNEERKTRVNLNAKLELLKDAINSDVVNLKEIKKGLTFKIYSMQHLLTLAGENKASLKRYEKVGLFILSYDDTNRWWPGAFPDVYNRDFIELAFALTGSPPVLNVNKSAYDELKSTGLLSLIKNDTLVNSLDVFYNGFELEYSKFINVCYLWGEELKEQGVLYFDIQDIKDPLNLVKNSPRALACFKEVIYESLWIGHRLEQRLMFIDSIAINQLEREIHRSD